MGPAKERLLLASIHDVSPRFESEVGRLRDLLSPHVGDRIALLVVPNHWGDAPIVAGSPFAARLREWAEAGAEIFLHGFYHRDDFQPPEPGGESEVALHDCGRGEFLGLTREEARSRIAKGRKVIEDVIGRAVDGFIAPAWHYGPGALEALAEAKLPLAEDHLKVWSPATGRKLASGPVITWSSRTRARLASSLVAAGALRHAPLKTLRVGVHPPDVRHPHLVRSIEKTLSHASRNRRAARYADLLA